MYRTRRLLTRTTKVVSKAAGDHHICGHLVMQHSRLIRALSAAATSSGMSAQIAYMDTDSKLGRYVRRWSLTGAEDCHIDLSCLSGHAAMSKACKLSAICDSVCFRDSVYWLDRQRCYAQQTVCHSGSQVFEGVHCFKLSIIHSCFQA